jgi:hypothetical protein
MRLLVALLAVLGLLASEVSEAARTPCSNASASAMNPRAAMPEMDHAGRAADPCCDPMAHHRKGCAQACAAMFSVAVTNHPILPGVSHSWTLADWTPGRATPARAGAWPGPERPPKTIA